MLRLHTRQEKNQSSFEYAMIYTNDSFTQLICELENNCPPTWQLYTNGRIEKRCTIETYIKTNVLQWELPTLYYYGEK